MISFSSYFLTLQELFFDKYSESSLHKEPKEQQQRPIPKFHHKLDLLQSHPIKKANQESLEKKDLYKIFFQLFLKNIYEHLYWDIHKLYLQVYIYLQKSKLIPIIIIVRCSKNFHKNILLITSLSIVLLQKAKANHVFVFLFSSYFFISSYKKNRKKISTMYIMIPIAINIIPNPTIPTDVPKTISANFPPVYALKPNIINNAGTPYAITLAINSAILIHPLKIFYNCLNHLWVSLFSKCLFLGDKCFDTPNRETHLLIVNCRKKIEKIDIFWMRCTHYTRLYQSQFNYNGGVVVFYFTVSTITPHLNFSNSSTTPIPIPKAIKVPPTKVIPSDVPNINSANFPLEYAENPNRINKGGVPYATAFPTSVTPTIVTTPYYNEFFVRSYLANSIWGKSSCHTPLKEISYKSQKLMSSRKIRIFSCELVHPPSLTAPHEFEQDYLQVHIQSHHLPLQSKNGQMTKHIFLLSCSSLMQVCMQVEFINIWEAFPLISLAQNLMTFLNWKPSLSFTRILSINQSIFLYTLKENYIQLNTCIILSHLGESQRSKNSPHRPLFFSIQVWVCFQDNYFILWFMSLESVLLHDKETLKYVIKELKIHLEHYKKTNKYIANFIDSFIIDLEYDLKFGNEDVVENLEKQLRDSIER